MNAPQSIPGRIAKGKFLSLEMLASARAQAAYLEAQGFRGSATMLHMSVTDIETYREAFKGAAITLNHAGGMLKRNDNELREASRSLAFAQLKCSVLLDAARDALAFLDSQIADYRVADGIEDAAALHAVADELRAAIEVAGQP